MPVPVDPFPDFVPHTPALADQVDARFKKLYDTLNPSVIGLDDTNVKTGGLFNATMALPSSPRDGQECYLVGDITNGVLWNMRYRAAATSTYKWEFVGGPELIANVDATNIVSSSTYAAISGGPTLTIPFAGDWMIGIGAEINPSAVVAYVSYNIGAAAALDTDAIVFGSTTAAVDGSCARFKRQNSLAAGTVLTMVAKGSGSASAVNYGKRWISARPIRCI